MNHRISTIAAGLTLAAGGAWAQTAPSATVVQNGVGNQSYVEQYQAGDLATVSIVQTGNYNIIGDPASGTGGILQHNTQHMTVAVTQQGEANQLTLHHVEGGFFGQAYINQSGTGNVATLIEDGSYEAYMQVEQHGQRNLIEDRATGLAAPSFRPQQYGSDNVITTIRNYSGYIGLPIYQEGSGNRATVTLDNAFYSGMAISQVGNDNEARGSLTDTASFVTDATITQNGAGNLAITDISGSGVARTTQTGDANTAIINQSLVPNNAIISQVGNLNTASVTQGGVPGASPNVAWIMQVGEGFAASITQTGSANSAGIYQH